MGFADKAENKSEETVGKLKEQAGDLTGNEELERDGKSDQASAKVKQAGEKVKDAASSIADTFRKD